MAERVFAFVFARGGSKGLPRKNVKLLDGIPLLAHSIRCAHSMPAVERVFVSTDDPEIAAVAREWNADVIDRPSELATDTASEWLAWRHAIQVASDKAGPFDVFLSLPATSPLRSTEDVSACLQALAPGSDMVITVTTAARSPYFNMIVRDADGTSKLCIEAPPLARRQDSPLVFDITTVAYVTRPSFVLGHDRMFDGVVTSVIVPRERAADIDDALDFQWCEFLVQHRKDNTHAQ